MKIYKLFLIAGISLTAFGCNDFLDKLPDNRTVISNTENLGELLVSAYPDVYFGGQGEMASDNMRDNGTGYSMPLTEFEEMYLWKDGETERYDDVSSVWSGCYSAIASANEALQYIEEQGNPKSLSAYRAEALMCRAYNHFVLVNIFCHHYSHLTSATDLGIPYVEKPETTVHVEYPRGTVKEVYQKINRDIEAALPYINDAIYESPKYHFNTRAAYAFAARFNLFYNNNDGANYAKVIQYANIAIGGAANADLRDYRTYATLARDEYRINFVTTSQNCNLLLSSVVSIYQRVWYGYIRYAHNYTIYRNQTYGASGIWSYGTGDYVWGSMLAAGDAVYLPSNLYGEWFVYSNKSANIGLPHFVWPLFTTDDALLCRVEANVMLGNTAAALADLTLWKTHRGMSGAVTLAQINSLYGSTKAYNESGTKKHLYPDFDLPLGGDKEALIHCVLHCRRVDNMGNGTRWFDVKRYGIQVTHNHEGEADLVSKIVKDDGSHQTNNDPRRAIQLPAAVIAAGIPANPR